MKSIKCAAIAVLLSSSFITPAFATAVTPSINQASDSSPVTQSDMESYCAAQHPETNYDGVNDRFSVDADSPSVGNSAATADFHNINYRPDTGSTFVYAQFLYAANPLTRTGGSVNMWGQSVFGQKIWDNTLYDVETRFEHTVGYSWTCNYEQLQVVDHEWEWDQTDVPSQCEEPTYPGADSCTVTTEVPVVGGGNSNGDNGCGAGGENGTNDDQTSGNSGNVCGTTGGNGGNGGNGGKGGNGGNGGNAGGDNGCGAGGEGTNDDETAGNSDHVCGENNGGGNGGGGGGTTTVTNTYTGHWNPIYDWVAVGSAEGSATHTIDDGYFTTETADQLAGHYGTVNYTETGQYRPAGVRTLACINPGKKGGTWTVKNGYTGGNCNTTYFNTALTAAGTTFDTITGVLPSNSLPSAP